MEPLFLLKNNIMKKILIILLLVSPIISFSQSFKDKMKDKMVKDNSAMYECGYVHEDKVGAKINPMKALQKGMMKGFTDANNPDLGRATITVLYQAHLYPKPVTRWLIKTPGYETCGDAISAGFSNKAGIGLSSTDGEFSIDGKVIEKGSAGIYFQGFKPEERGVKTVKITSSNGDKIEFNLVPPEELSIITIDGKSKGESLEFDGSKDIEIKLVNGDADPNSKIQIQLIGKMMGTPILFDLLVTKPKNTIIIPKEAFKNFSGSPSPFDKNNTIIISRVIEEVLDGTAAGAIRTICSYSDCMPVTITGKLAKGNVITMGMDSTKNTAIEMAIDSHDYTYNIKKGNPYAAPPIDKMNNIAVASFVIRANLEKDSVYSKTYETSTMITTVTTTITKWFPELSEETWENLAVKLYDNFASTLEKTYGANVLSLSEVVNSQAYDHIKPIVDTVSQTFAQVGAGGTERILTTTSGDFFTDLSITFGADYISERMIKELNVDAVVAVTLDLNFNFTTRGLDPILTMVIFAPNVSQNTGGNYFTMSANTEAKSLEDSAKYSGSTEDALYQMIKADDFYLGFGEAMKQLSVKEKEYPAYEILWQARQ